MAQPTPSLKQLLINQANSRILIVTSAATFVVIFGLVMAYSLVGQLAYQDRVMDKKKLALKTLQEDIKAVDKLKASYVAFTSTSQNVLGGSPLGNSDRDGDNSKLILDALPSKYDYPALATSIEKIVSMNGGRIENFTGTDDEVSQGEQETSSNPQPVEMPFEVTVVGNYKTIQDILGTMQRSIRPIEVSSVTFTAQESNLSTLINGKSYYQPTKALKIRTEVVK